MRVNGSQPNVLSCGRIPNESGGESGGVAAPAHLAPNLARGAQSAGRENAGRGPAENLVRYGAGQGGYLRVAGEG
jgi:hypothetical protein